MVPVMACCHGAPSHHPSHCLFVIIGVYGIHLISQKQPKVSIATMCLKITHLNIYPYLPARFNKLNAVPLVCSRRTRTRRTTRARRHTKGPPSTSRTHRPRPVLTRPRDLQGDHIRNSVYTVSLLRGLASRQSLISIPRMMLLLGNWPTPASTIPRSRRLQTQEWPASCPQEVSAVWVHLTPAPAQPENCQLIYPPRSRRYPVVVWRKWKWPRYITSQWRQFGLALKILYLAIYRIWRKLPQRAADLVRVVMIGGKSYMACDMTMNTPSLLRSTWVVERSIIPVITYQRSSCPRRASDTPVITWPSPNPSTPSHSVNPPPRGACHSLGFVHCRTAGRWPRLCCPGRPWRRLASRPYRPPTTTPTCL